MVSWGKALQNCIVMEESLDTCKTKLYSSLDQRFSITVLWHIDVPQELEEYHILVGQLEGGLQVCHRSLGRIYIGRAIGGCEPIQ